jgi:hypothetical protein
VYMDIKNKDQMNTAAGRDSVPARRRKHLADRYTSNGGEMMVLTMGRGHRETAG